MKRGFSLIVLQGPGQYHTLVQPADHKGWCNHGPALMGFVRHLPRLALALADPTVPRVANTDPVWDLTGPANWDRHFHDFRSLQFIATLLMEQVPHPFKDTDLLI